MSEPVYFAVVRHHGRDSPRRFFRKGELIYCTRLDLMPNADAMITAPLDQLMRVYRALKRENRLPAENRGGKPKPPEGKTTVKLGERLAFSITWDADAPFIGWPEVKPSA